MLAIRFGSRGYLQCQFACGRQHQQRRTCGLIRRLAAIVAALTGMRPRIYRAVMLRCSWAKRSIAGSMKAAVLPEPVGLSTSANPGRRARRESRAAEQGRTGIASGDQCRNNFGRQAEAAKNDGR